jgi:hypothetical protein
MDKGKKRADETIIPGQKQDTKTIIFDYSKKIFSSIIIPIIVSLIIGYLLFNFQYNDSLNKERKNIANGYISDLEDVNLTLTGAIQHLDDPNDPDYHKSMTKMTNYLYPPWGLYYSNRQDIQKFDSNTSNNLYYFYHELLFTEQTRVLYNNFDANDIFPPTNNTTILLAHIQNSIKIKEKMANDMYNNIHDCHDNQLPKLIDELKKIRDS